MSERDQICVTGDYASGGGAFIDKSNTFNLTINLQVTKELLESDASFLNKLVKKIQELIGNDKTQRIENIPVIDVQGASFGTVSVDECVAEFDRVQERLQHLDELVEAARPFTEFVGLTHQSDNADMETRFLGHDSRLSLKLGHYRRLRAILAKIDQHKE